MTYEFEVQAFANEYAEIHTQKILAEKLDVSPTTLHTNMKRQGGFAPKTHGKVVRYLENIATELHAQGLPLKLDGVPIPLRDSFLAAMTGEVPTAHTDDEDAPAQEDNRASMAPPMEGGQVEAANASNSDQEGDTIGADNTPIVVADGTSVLDPAIWKSGPPMDTAGYYDPQLVEEDLRQTFEVSNRELLFGGDDALHGWKGPSASDDATRPASASFEEDIVRLAAEWRHYVDALEVAREAGAGVGDRVYVYASLQRCRRELLLIGDHYMTPPSRQVELDDFERQQEVQRLRSEIQEISAALQAFEERPGFLGLFRKVR